jgi:hypothetical protein
MAAKLLYDQDFVEWTQYAARALHEGRLDKADIDLVAMKTEYMGKRDRRSVENNLRVLLHQLLKWHFQPAKRSASWKPSILEHRGWLELVLRDFPSLKNRAISELDEIYSKAAHTARIETGLESLPARCPWDLDELLRPEFFPE